MYIEKTTLLPNDDIALADAILDCYLHEQQKTLFIVLGDDMYSRRLVEKADRWAGLIEEPRWLIWIRNRAHVKQLVVDMKDPNKLVKDWNNVLAFTVSINDNICDVINNTTDEIKSSVIIKAYARAEANTPATTTAPVIASRGVVTSRSITPLPMTEMPVVEITKAKGKSKKKKDINTNNNDTDTPN